MKPISFILCFCLLQLQLVEAQKSMLIEAESFSDKGAWLVDPQFVQQMGSPYLIAHGMGEPVRSAKTDIKVHKRGNYHVWARTKNWVPGPWEAPGQFEVSINDKLMENRLGLTPGWGWEYAGKIKLKKGLASVELIDRTGFNGRCDAIYLSKIKDDVPPNDGSLDEWRTKKLNEPAAPEESRQYDLVITGGGLAGCAAAIAASEEGLKVALIHDRPVLGGNASEEIRVHTLGIYGKFERILKMIDTEHYPNGHPDAKIDQKKRDENMKLMPGLDLYLNWRAYDAKAKNDIVQYVDARQTSDGRRIRFTAPLFVDATGDGWIGYWSGAEFSYGRESVYKYGEAWDQWGELWSPEEADNMVMGSSVLWRTKWEEEQQFFPQVPWAMDVAKEHKAIAGEWYWEFSRNDVHQIHDAEDIRDHMLRAIYGSYSNAKEDDENANYAETKFPDSVVVEIRDIDVHFQRILEDESNPDFLSKALFYRTPYYYIPYRSLYSKNINNLLMAGRCFSCSHVGLGGPRVMRTTGQMGAAVGFAASICKKYNVLPRAVYTDHLEEYMQLIINQQRKDPN